MRHNVIVFWILFLIPILSNSQSIIGLSEYGDSTGHQGGSILNFNIDSLNYEFTFDSYNNYEPFEIFKSQNGNVYIPEDDFILIYDISSDSLFTHEYQGTVPGGQFQIAGEDSLGLILFKERMIYKYGFDNDSIVHLFEIDSGWSIYSLLNSFNGTYYGLITENGNWFSIMEYHPDDTSYLSYPINQSFGRWYYAKIIQASDSNIYTYTERAGLTTGGNILQFNTVTKSIQSIHTFPVNYGSSTYGPKLIEMHPGWLYGFKNFVANHPTHSGVLFRIQIPTGNSYQDLHHFLRNGDVNTPEWIGRLSYLELIGTTRRNIFEKSATVFKYHSLFDTLTVIKEYDSIIYESGPSMSVVVDSTALLSFSGTRNGIEGMGDLHKFHIQPDTIEVLMNFFETTHGQKPKNIWESDQQKLYGINSQGKIGNQGTLFSYDITSGNITTLYKLGNLENPIFTEVEGILGKLNDNLLLEVKHYFLDPFGFGTDSTSFYIYNLMTDSIQQFDVVAGNNGIPGVFGGLVKSQNNTFYGTSEAIISSGGWIPFLNKPGGLFEFDPAQATLNDLILYPDSNSVPNSNIVTFGNEIFGLKQRFSWWISGPIYLQLFQYDLLSNDFEIIDSIISPLGNQPIYYNEPIHIVSDQQSAIYGISGIPDSTYRSVPAKLWKYELGDSLIQVVHEFDSLVFGIQPKLDIYYDSVNNSIYGFTDSGGVNNEGVIYEYNLNTSSYNVLYHLTQDLGWVTLVNITSLIVEINNLFRNQQLFSVYPNPAYYSFKVKSDNTELKYPIQLRLHDLMGKEVMRTKINSTHELIKVSNLPPALYIVKVQVGNKIYTQKLLKK